MTNIHISKSAPSIEVSGDLLLHLEHVAQEVLRHTKAPPSAELTLVLSDDAQIQSLNHQFLGVDAPTDVLAFPSGETDPDGGQLYLGDVIISCRRAQIQADAGGHTFEQEMQLLIVHGVLHLLGYNHEIKLDKKKMWILQDEILSQIGSPIRSPI